jgi:hypothetical protein
VVRDCALKKKSFRKRPNSVGAAEPMTWEECERGVDSCVNAEDQRREAQPAHADDEEPGMKSAPAGSGAADVEGSVFVDGATQGGAKFACQAWIECRLLHVSASFA